MYFPTRLSYAYDLTGPDHATASLAGINIATRIGMIPGAIIVGVLAIGSAPLGHLEISF